MPSTRKDLMFERRKREEAEGERRMMGSGLRLAFFDAGLAVRMAGVSEGVGADDFDERRKRAVYFRTCEKSCT